MLKNQSSEINSNCFRKECQFGTALLLFLYENHHNYYFDEELTILGIKGVYFYYGRLESWINIRNIILPIKEVLLFALGYAFFDSDIIKKDEIYEFFGGKK